MSSLVTRKVRLSRSRSSPSKVNCFSKQLWFILEGFAMDWSGLEPGRLLTGDCSRSIYLWEKTDAGWNVQRSSFRGHTDSVEDIQWSPTEKQVCSRLIARETTCPHTKRIIAPRFFFFLNHVPVCSPSIAVTWIAKYTNCSCLMTLDLKNKKPSPGRG